jgi:ketosteroid isomerase-like protein
MRYLFLLSIILSLFACNATSEKTNTPAPFSPESVKAKITSGTQHISSGVEKKDTALIASVYTANARLSPDNETFVVGKTAIAAWYQEKFTILKGIEFITISIDGTADVIYETGVASVKINYKDSTWLEQVKYTNVWRLQADSSYKIVIDMWNNLPDEDDHNHGD